MNQSIDSRLAEASPSTSSLNLPPTNATPSESTTVSSPGTVQRASTPLANISANKLLAADSRPATPDGFPRASYLSSAILSPFLGSSPVKTGSKDNPPDDTRTLISRAFVPHIAVLASKDTDEIARSKGFAGGFREVIRPFGDAVQGRVTVRDQSGLSRSFSDFGIRFVGLGDGLEDPNPRAKSPEPGGSEMHQPSQSGRRTGGDIRHTEELIKWHLDQLGPDRVLNGDASDSTDLRKAGAVFKLYLRSLLSGLPLVPSETFTHPAACMILISSRNKAPIEALRKLYEIGSKGEGRLPSWVNSEYLRYYVLVHDEDQGDITQSTQLFDQMKRHFGTHCHLLRIRSVRAVPSDDGTVEATTCEWRSAAEELIDLRGQSIPDLSMESNYLFETDVSAMRTLVREMVSMSIIPTMERNISVWNNEIAAKRRTLTGRMFSAGRRWAGFGGSSSSSRSSSQDPPSTPGGSGSHYNTLYGYYQPASPQALLRKLADYAFMLRDYKFAAEIYEMLKRDFSNDKAWRYYAGAHEMALLSHLQFPPNVSTKLKPEALDNLLDQALYSYLTRCSYPFGALRCLVAAIDQLLCRGAVTADDAARWAYRGLKEGILGPMGVVLFHWKIATCYQTRNNPEGQVTWGSRRRKAAMWMLLTAEKWADLREWDLAGKCTVEGLELYGIDTSKEAMNANMGSWQGLGKWVNDLQSRIENVDEEGFQAEGEDEEESAEMMPSRLLWAPRIQTGFSSSSAPPRTQSPVEPPDEDEPLVGENGSASADVSQDLDPLKAAKMGKLRLSSERPERI